MIIIGFKTLKVVLCYFLLIALNIKATWFFKFKLCKARRGESRLSTPIVFRSRKRVDKIYSIFETGVVGVDPRTRFA